MLSDEDRVPVDLRPAEDLVPYHERLRQARQRVGWDRQRWRPKEPKRAADGVDSDDDPTGEHEEGDGEEEEEAEEDEAQQEANEARGAPLRNAHPTGDPPHRSRRPPARRGLLSRGEARASAGRSPRCSR